MAAERPRPCPFAVVKAVMVLAGWCLAAGRAAFSLYDHAAPRFLLLAESKELFGTASCSSKLCQKPTRSTVCDQRRLIDV